MGKNTIKLEKDHNFFLALDTKLLSLELITGEFCPLNKAMLI